MDIDLVSALRTSRPRRRALSSLSPSSLEFASVPTTKTTKQLGMRNRYQSIGNTIV